MIIYDLLFYCFAFLLVMSALGVILFRNTVYSVLLLIFTFLNAATLFVLVGAEFLAMSLIIVYVGAVAVLFLFVVMMLNISIIEAKKYIVKNYKLLIIISVVFLAELIAIIYLSVQQKSIVASAQTPLIFDGVKSNTQQIGLVLYNNFGYLFQLCGVILFVAIIGAIALTDRQAKNIKRQNVADQLRRNKQNSVKLMSVKVGEGVDAITK